MSKVLVLYHSQEFGNTKLMAEAVADGACRAGAEVVLHNTNDSRYDVEAYRKVDALAFGSPDYYSYIAGGLKMFLDDWHIARGQNPAGMDEKPCALFCSHGGGGKVRGVLEALCSRLGKSLAPLVESKGKPNTAVLDACRELGRTLALAPRATSR
jgi:NAD(P)H dehydrogenase (quinone)